MRGEGKRHVATPPQRALSYLVLSGEKRLSPVERYRAAMPRNWLLTLIALSDPFKRAFTKRRRTQKFNTVYGSRPVFGLPGILEKLNSPESGEFIFKPGYRPDFASHHHGIRANCCIYEARRTSGGNYYYYRY